MTCVHRVMKTLIIDEAHENQRIDKYLKKLLVKAPSSLVYKMLRKKDVKVNGKRVKENYILRLGDEVSLFLYDDKYAAYTEPTVIADVPISFDVAYEDEHILIVNKPAGILVHEADDENQVTLTHQVLRYLYDRGAYDPEEDLGFTPGPVHRLDRNTSGLVIFGKDMRALQDLNEMMKQRHCIEKHYQTIVKGRMQDAVLKNYVKKNEEEGKMYLVSPETAGALYMETHVRVIKARQEASLCDVQLITGRTHQIRVHLASCGHPVMGDRKYGDFAWNRQIRARYHLNHQFLHAYQLRFIRPIRSLKYLTGKTITCDLPAELNQISDDIFH